MTVCSNTPYKSTYLFHFYLFCVKTHLFLWLASTLPVTLKRFSSTFQPVLSLGFEVSTELCTLELHIADLRAILHSHFSEHSNLWKDSTTLFLSVRRLLTLITSSGLQHTDSKAEDRLHPSALWRGSDRLKEISLYPDLLSCFSRCLLVLREIFGGFFPTENQMTC